MKRYSLLFASVFGAIACAILRIRQIDVGFEEETGLAVPGTVLPLVLALAAVAALLLYFSFSYARTQDKSRPALPDYFDLDSSAAVAVLVCGSFLLAAAGALSFASTSYPTTLSGNGVFSIFSLSFSKIIGIFSIFSAVCLLVSLALARKRAEQSGGIYLLVPLAFLLVELVAMYRRTGNNPVLASFYVEILAISALVVAYSQLSAISLGIGHPRRCAFFTALSFVLCACALVACTDFADLALFSAFSLLQFGFLLAFSRKNG